MPETSLVLKRISILRLALFAGAFSAVVGLIMGVILYAIMSAVMSLMAGLIGSGAASTGLDAVFIVLYPVIGFVSGFGIGALCAFFYNMWSARIGGVILTVDEAN